MIIVGCRQGFTHNRLAGLSLKDSVGKKEKKNESQLFCPPQHHCRTRTRRERKKKDIHKEKKKIFTNTNRKQKDRQKAIKWYKISILTVALCSFKFRFLEPTTMGRFLAENNRTCDQLTFSQAFWTDWRWNMNMSVFSSESCSNKSMKHTQIVRISITVCWAGSLKRWERNIDENWSKNGWPSKIFAFILKNLDS